ncbi:MAG: hypothetical protein JXR95_11175 [Deltaproteobacteria bacterium]|nr:hypothetical protein [Deltaproteobacteria bacterium]
MKLTFISILIVSGMFSCRSYESVATTTTGNKVIIAKNNSFLFGALSSVVVCDLDGNKLTNCQSSEP